MALLAGLLPALLPAVAGGQPAAHLAFRLPLDPPSLFSFAPQQLASPVVAADARFVVAGTAGGKLFLVTADSGEILNTWDLGGGISASPLLLPADRMVVATEEGTVHLLSVCDGRSYWSQPPRIKGAIRSVPVLLGDGVVLVHDDRSVLTAIDLASGKLLASYDAHSFTERGAAPFTRFGYPSPATDGGSVFAGFEDGHVVRLSLSAGGASAGDAGDSAVKAFKPSWDVSLCGLDALRKLPADATVCPSNRVYSDVDSSPIVTAHGVLAGCYCRGLAMLSADDGTVRWERPLIGPATGLVTRDAAFVAGSDGRVTSVNLANGRTLWSTGVTISMLSAPALLGSADDLPAASLVVASGGDLYFLDATRGTILASLRTRGGFSASGAASGNALFILSNEGALYRIDFFR